jgi:hypothetical protein
MATIASRSRQFQGGGCVVRRPDRFSPDNLDWFDVLVEEGEDRARELLRYAVRHARLERR